MILIKRLSLVNPLKIQTNRTCYKLVIKFFAGSNAQIHRSYRLQGYPKTTTVPPVMPARNHGLNFATTAVAPKFRTKRSATIDVGFMQ
jgi:hypothetical protein